MRLSAAADAAAAAGLIVQQRKEGGREGKQNRTRQSEMKRALYAPNQLPLSLPASASVHAGNASRAANNESQRVNDVSLLQSEEVS